MAMAAVTTGTYTDRRRRTEGLRHRHAFAREPLDFYGALLGVQEQAYEGAISARPPAHDLVAYTAEVVVPSVRDASPSGGPPMPRGSVAPRPPTTHPRARTARWIPRHGATTVDPSPAHASAGP